jgi:hypothetical protein
MFTSGRELIDAQMHQWGDSIDSVIEDARSTASKHVQDNRPLLQPSGTEPLDLFKLHKVNNTLDFYFHNPIAATISKFNPVTILTNAVEWGFEDALAESDYTLDLSTRSVWTKLAEIFAEFLVKETDNFQRLITEITDRCSAVLEDFSRFQGELTSFLGDAFWTMFDAIKIVAVQLWNLITDLIDAIMDLMQKEMKIPFIADLWQEFAEQPFTLWNVVSYVCAKILNIISLSTTGKLPFEAWGDPRIAMRKLVSSTRARDNVDKSTTNGVAPQEASHIRALQNDIHIAGATENEKLEIDNEKLEIDNEKLETDNGKVEPDDPKPQPDNEKPQPDNEKPQPDNEKPQPDNPKPQPDNPKPQPDNPKPQPDNPKPQPDNPKPQPDNPKPQPDSELLQIEKAKLQREGDETWQKWNSGTALAMNLFSTFSGIVSCYQTSKEANHFAEQTRRRVGNEGAPGAARLSPRRTRFLQNVQFGCDALQIVAQVLALAQYSQLGNTNAPFRESQSPSFIGQVSAEIIDSP